MKDDPSRKDEARAERERRLAEALRANLRRRKAQARDRKSPQGPSAAGETEG